MRFDGSLGLCGGVGNRRTFKLAWLWKIRLNRLRLSHHHTGFEMVLLFQPSAPVPVKFRAVEENNLVGLPVAGFFDPPLFDVAMVLQFIERWFELAEDMGRPSARSASASMSARLGGWLNGRASLMPMRAPRA